MTVPAHRHGVMTWPVGSLGVIGPWTLSAPRGKDGEAANHCLLRQDRGTAAAVHTGLQPGNEDGALETLIES